jgi:predicted site-specific integrase-resolvase
VKPEMVTPSKDNSVVVGINEAEQALHVSKVTIYRWLREGFIAGEQDVPGGPWRIRIDDAMRAKVVGQAPPGWLRLDEAATALAVARQTVLDRVRRGQLRAVYVNRGRRKGLAIQVGTGTDHLPGTAP